MSEALQGEASGAATTYAWLEGLEAHKIERVELLTAGVAAHTISSLFPADFAPIALLMAARVNVIDIRDVVTQKRRTLRARRKMMVQLLNDLPERFERLRAEEMDASGYQDEVEPLSDALFDQFGGSANGQIARVSCCSMLWHLWWLAHRRDELPAELHEKLDVIANWLGASVLKLAPLDAANMQAASRF